MGENGTDVIYKNIKGGILFKLCVSPVKNQLDRMLAFVDNYDQ